LRTPLTSLVGLAESLALSRPALSPAQLDMARSLQSETVRMSALVANLLDMARIESGHVRLNLQWQALEEVVGSALRASGAQLQQHKVQTQLAPDLPLVRYDAVLVEAQAVGANAKAATADLGPLRADVESNLRKVEQLVNEINRKWPFKRNPEIKLP